MSINYQKRKFKDIDNTGYTATQGSRLVNKDGSNNLYKTGLSLLDRYSLYHTLLRMPRIKFLLLVFLFYTSINVLFACIYLLIGVERLSGVEVTDSVFTNFTSAFFFSSQTLTTVGYGHVSPSGLTANSIAAVESFLGIMTFALVTGMFYARFSRPQAFIRFSNNIIVAPYKDGKGLMFRVATYKNNHLTDVEATVTCVIHVEENGQRSSRFFPLALEIARIGSLAVSWTCVHHLNDDSPISQFTEQQLIEGRIEILVTVKAFDDHFSNTVQQRTSYSHEELVYGARFQPMSHRPAEGGAMVVMMDKLSHWDAYLFEASPK